MRLHTKEPAYNTSLPRHLALARGPRAQQKNVASASRICEQMGSASIGVIRRWRRQLVAIPRKFGDRPVRARFDLLADRA